MMTLVLSLLLMSTANAEMKPQSSHLRNFAIQSCGSQKCFQASGELAFVSMSGDMISAADAKLVLAQKDSVKTETFHCASMTYVISSHYFFCDNQDSKKEVTLILDPEVNARKYAPKG